METVNTLINRLPIGYLMIMIPLIIVVGLWTFSKVRRDKNGKIYWYSDKYEKRKSNSKMDKIINGIASLAKDASENRKHILQLQIISSNGSKLSKQDAYREYISMGYNSWADQYVLDNGIFTSEEVASIKNGLKNGLKDIALTKDYYNTDFPLKGDRDNE